MIDDNDGLPFLFTARELLQDSREPVVIDEANVNRLVDVIEGLDENGTDVFLNVDAVELSQYLVIEASAVRIIGNSSIGRVSISCSGTEAGIRIRYTQQCPQS